MKVHNEYAQMIYLKYILFHHTITALKFENVIYLCCEVTNLYDISIVSESPRWLLSKGRKNEAKKVIRKMARLNNKDIPKDYFQKFEEDHVKVYHIQSLFSLYLFCLSVYTISVFPFLLFFYFKNQPKSSSFRAFKANVFFSYNF